MRKFINSISAHKIELSTLDISPEAYKIYTGTDIDFYADNYNDDIYAVLRSSREIMSTLSIEQINDFIIEMFVND